MGFGGGVWFPLHKNIILAARYLSVCLSVCLSLSLSLSICVCVCVCVSVTFVDCVKTNKHLIFFHRRVEPPF